MKIRKAVEILEYFTTKQWEFTNDNAFMLMNEMSTEDNQVYNSRLIHLRCILLHKCIYFRRFRRYSALTSET